MEFGAISDPCAFEQLLHGDQLAGLSFELLCAVTKVFDAVTLVLTDSRKHTNTRTLVRACKHTHTHTHVHTHTHTHTHTQTSCVVGFQEFIVIISDVYCQNRSDNCKECYSLNSLALLEILWR